MQLDDAIGNPRGDSTRDALIQAAIGIFGRHGFDAAGTRTIAEAAGVNQALISYHFGGKPGLYLAALQFIADSASRRMSGELAAVEADLSAREDDRATEAQRALRGIHRLTAAFFTMLTAPETEDWARLILPEQQTPSAGFDLLYDGFIGRMMSVTTTLVSRARGISERSAEARLTAVTLLGQVLVFRAGRAAVMRQMRWRRIGKKEAAAARRQLRHNVNAILFGEVSA